MMDAMQVGLSGMRAAETDATARALNIANVNTKGYVPVEPATNGAGGSGIGAGFRQETLTPQTGSALADIAGNGVNLADELINLRLAETAYKASAKVVQTANEMSDTLLKALG
jgi:flagellar hook-associated protein FlgK